MKKAIPIIAILGLFMAAPATQAAAPQLVPVQGVLTDSTDAPIDATVSAVFSLYTSEVGGTALWTETQSVLVEDGLFTAYMGDVTTLDLTLFRDNGNLWLGITIDSDAEMDRVMLGSNPFSAYSEWCGNHPTPDFSDITGTVDPGDLPSGVVVGALSCSGTQKVSGINSSGALVCSADLDSGGSSYTAGTGLLLSGTTFSANTTYLQRRVTGTCGTNSAIRAISVTGTVTCQTVYTGDVTSVTAGTGLNGGGSSGALTINLNAMESTVVTTSISLANNASNSSVEAQCATGWRVTGGGCHPGRENMWIINQFPNTSSNRWRCGFHNRTGSTNSAWTYATCTRITP